MKAVILAAGKGERLSKGKSKLNAKPKPLIPLLGLSLLERAILSAKESGIYDFVIVVGYRSEEVVKYVEEKQNRLGLNIDFVENEEWEKGNGLSVLKARETLKEEDFVLLMCDHVFDSSILKELLEYAKNRERKCVLCVDEPENVFDLEDATKILLERNKPNAIGKGIKNYNAVDCGIFYCTAEMLDALEAEIGKGKYELSDAVQCLIECDKLEVFDIGGRRFWCDIDTQESLEYAKNKMLKSLEKPTDGIISKCINRKISKRITARIVNTNLTPTQITIISFIMALASAAFFLLGEHKYLVIGGILAQASSIIDGCDGEGAGLKFLITHYVDFVDSIPDRYSDGIMSLGLIFGYWMLHGGILRWIFWFFPIIWS
ncbi:MAG: NTP transferase domain-containing protein, partial [Methanomicrobia archaeon]|nr:NTP transferase domain-containing protein [Methanomicrobia archaeon]